MASSTSLATSALNKKLYPPCPMDIKIDKKQVTIPLDMHLIPAARCVLYKRYTDKHLWPSPKKCTWTDETSRPIQTLHLDSNKYNNIANLPTSLPANLHLTRAQIDEGNKKLVTATLYYTTGTLLIQGNYCPDWREEEAHSLYALFHHFYLLHSSSRDSIASSLDNDIKLITNTHPPPSPSPSQSSPTPRSRRHSTRLQIKANLTTKEDQPRAMKALTYITDTSKCLTSEVEVEKQSLTTLNETESQQSTNREATPLSPHCKEGGNNNAQASQIASSTAVSPSTPTLIVQQVKDPTNVNQINETITTSQNKERSYIQSINGQQKEANVQDSMQTDESQWTDEETENKNNESTNTKKKNLTSAKLARRKQYSKRFTIKPTSLTAIKTSITEINRGINKKQRSFDNFKTTCDKVLNNVLSKIEQSRVHTKNALKAQYNDKFQQLEERIAKLEGEVNNLRNDNKSLCSQIKDLRVQLKTKPTPTCSHPPKLSTTNKSVQIQIPDSTPSHAAVPLHNPVTSKETFQNYSSTAKPQTQATLKKKNDLKQDENGKNVLCMSQDMGSSNSRGTANSSGNPDTPLERLAKRRVSTETEHLLIGDSVFTKVNPEPSFDNSTTSESIAISGMKIHDLLQWLRHVPKSNQVKKVVVHVGINTCRSGITIEKELWNNLTTSIKNVFCNAQVYFSSIIPPSQIRIQADLVENVNKSNDNLYTVCKASGTTYIDNNPLFVTRRGLPKKTMYYDAIHPSPDGSYALSANIKQYTTTRFTQQMYPQNQQFQKPREPAESLLYWKGHEDTHNLRINHQPNLHTSSVYRTPTANRRYEDPQYRFNTAERHNQPPLLETPPTSNDLYRSYARSPRADYSQPIRTLSDQGQQVRLDWTYRHHRQSTGSRHDAQDSRWMDRNLTGNNQQNDRRTWLHYNGPQHLMPLYNYRE